MIDRTAYLEAARQALTQSGWVQTGPNQYDRFKAVYGYLVKASAPVDVTNRFTVTVEGSDGKTRSVDFADAELAEPLDEWHEYNRQRDPKHHRPYQRFVSVERFVQQIRDLTKELRPILPPKVLRQGSRDVAPPPVSETDEARPMRAWSADELVRALEQANLPVPTADRRTSAFKDQAIELLKNQQNQPVTA
jgi:hypothetical protein